MVNKITNQLARIKIPKTSKSKVPVSLRTVKGEAIYADHKKNGKTKSLSEEHSIKEWQHWRLIDNKFPYASVFKVHHMLIPKREVDKKNLSKNELREMDLILEELDVLYDCMLVNFNKKQSIKYHYHVHMLTYKDKRAQLKF